MQYHIPRPARRSGSNAALKTAVAALFLTLILIGSSPKGTSYAYSLAEDPQTKNPFEATETNTALGLDHFTAHCAACHGENGKADTERGKALGAADLTSQEVQSKSDAELFNIISKGVPGTAMPAFGKTHKPVEIWHTILFLRKLTTLTAEGRKRLEAAIPADARHKHEHKGEEGASHDHPAQPQSAEQHDHSKMHHQHDAQPGATEPDKPEAGDEHAGHDVGKMTGDHDMAAMMNTITGGPFKSMHAIGSGTSLLPASTPGYMWMWMKNDWAFMAHGDMKAGLNHQGGPRGVNKAESQNWLMLMAERPVGGGRLMLRGMFSAEPWTAPRRGFPELFQTGEVFEGRPIIDAQHPHDLFMELAASYTVALSERVSIHLYGGPVAEPALGPVAFMHRASASENPAAPLGHHWHDSTHIAHGVFTAGVTAGRFRIESSIFRGAEPDENRKTIELGKLDSYSGRVWFTPTPNWSMQVSYGYLTNPEELEPGDVKRLTASISHNRSWRDGNWASSLIWGRNSEEHGVSNAYLFESTVNFIDKNYLYTRLELADRTGLLQANVFGRRGLVEDHHTGGTGANSPHDEGEGLAERWFRVGAFTFGGVRDVVTSSKLRAGIGADVTFYDVPEGLKAIYGSSPTSFHVFLRIRPGKMDH